MSESGFLEGGLAMLRHGPPKSQEEIDRERARSISNGACGLRKRRDRALPGAPRRQLQSRSPPSARAAAQPRVHVDLRRASVVLVHAVAAAATAPCAPFAPQSARRCG